MAFHTTQRIEVRLDATLLRSILRDLSEFQPLVSIIDVVRPESDAVWSVDLRADLGPIRRSKRLRMARVSADDEGTLVFERQELDNRRHASWRLTIEIQPVANGSGVEIILDYDGRVPLGVLEGLVAEEIVAASQRLESIIDERGAR